MKTLKPLLSFTLLILLSSNAFSETLLLKSGDQLIGKIISETTETVIIDVNNVPLQLRSEDIVNIIEDGVRRKVGEQPASAQESISSSTEVTPATQQEDLMSGMEIPPATQDVSPEGVTEATPPDTEPSDEEVDSSTPTPLLPVILPPGDVYQVTGSGIRFREGPSLDYPVVTTLPGQTLLIEIEFSDDWMRAKTLEEEEGWIHRNFIRKMENVPCLSTGNRVNVRESPGDVFRSFDRLSRGEVVVKLEEREDWFHVLTSNHIAGWTAKEYLLPLTNPNVYQPAMMVVVNSEVGMPILIDKKSADDGKVQMNLTVRDDSIIQSGKSKLLIFHKDRRFLQNDEPIYASESIFQQQRLPTPLEIINIGLPEELGIKFVGADILTMLGERVDDGWLYSLTAPDSSTLVYAFMVQEGSSRGTLILTQ